MVDSKPKRILVTGGAGFIGSHLCERLVFQGHEVLCVDNFYSGVKENISHLLDLANFTLLEHDISQPLSVPADEIFNLACPASPLYYQRDPVYTVKTCVFGAINMLELARAQNAKILQASTSEVYGDPDIHPQPEHYWGRVNPTGIRSCYAEGKRCAEALFFDYRRQYGTTTKVARIFNTYGPRMRADDGRVISNFAIQALQGRPITIFGDGNQTRSFCYIDDMVEGLIRLMNTGYDVAGAVNLGSPLEISVLGLGRMIARESGSLSPLVHCPLPEGDPKCRRPDISMAKEIMDWEPKVALEVGIRAVMDYFSSKLQRCN